MTKKEWIIKEAKENPELGYSPLQAIALFHISDDVTDFEVALDTLGKNAKVICDNGLNFGFSHLFGVNVVELDIK